MRNNKTDQFIELYKRLEEVIRDVYKLPPDRGAVKWLIVNDRSFSRVRDELEYCTEVRNLLQHKRRLSDDYAVIPSDAMLQTLRQTIAKLEGLPKARDLGVDARQVYAASMDSLIVPAMREMAKKHYTHIPILEDGRVTGTFSENTLLTYLIEEGTAFTETDCFAQIDKYLPLECHKTETFAFVGLDVPAPKIAELFQGSLRKSERLGVVFVTAHGKQSEKLLRMITSWDMAAFF